MTNTNITSEILALISNEKTETVDWMRHVVTQPRVERSAAALADFSLASDWHRDLAASWSKGDDDLEEAILDAITAANLEWAEEVTAWADETNAWAE